MTVIDHTQREVVLRCTCGLPYAKLVNGVLVVQARHHGEKHECVIPVSDLLALEFRGTDCERTAD